MKIFVQIDLSNADIPEFEDYEAKVLDLLVLHGARLEMRVRSKEGKEEFHLIDFPNAAAFEAFLIDPARLACRWQWDKCGATLTTLEVEVVR